MKKYKIILPLILGGLLVATPLIITSCSCSSSDDNTNNNTNQNNNNITNEVTNSILNTNEQYIKNQSNFLDNNNFIKLAQPDLTQSYLDIVVEQLQNIKQNANEAIVALNKVKTDNESKLNFDQTVWLDSYLFKWENIINNITNGTIFLGANPVTGSQILSSSSNHIIDLITSAINVYQIDPDTGDPGNELDQQLINTLNNRISDAIDTIKTIHKFLEIGSLYGIMPSSIAKKMFLNQTINKFYQLNLKEFVKTDAINNINIHSLITNLSFNQNFFGNKFNEFNDLKIDVEYSLLAKLSETLNDFIKFYSSTYYSNKFSYGPKIDQELTLLKQSNNEVEKTIIVDVDNKKTQVFGLGLTNNDLNEKNVGIGNMNIKPIEETDKLYGFIGSSGNDIYQQLLFNNNSINKSAVEIFNDGINLTNDGINKMNKIASLVKDIIKNKNFTGQIYYDPDGIGPEISKLQSITGSNDFEKLNNWLNQDDFYFGREHYNEENLLNFINYYWTNASGNLNNLKQTIVKQGYEKHWANQETINGLKTGTVSGNQALAGAVLSFESYNDFKNKTNNLYDSYFNPYKDYIISPYNYDVREFIGVGMEGPRGSCQFQYNCDPYYSIQKWSLSSLTVHEGKMGHHTQQEYWTEYLDKNGPGYVFENVAFHEGWAVFSEWFANEIGTYGSNLTDGIPTDWLNAKGIAPNYDENKINELTQQLKTIHGGVYYLNADGEDNTPTKLMNAIKLTNMLQYYGFLNEAQLRNMRLSVDIAYHYKDKNQNSQSSLLFGASINDVRNYMTKNSALGIGDIQSESIRYLVMPSQATGYMLGKLVFQDLYTMVQTTISNQNKNPEYTLVNDPNETKKLFDLMLKNGEVPLKVLETNITNTYNHQKF